MVYTRQQKRGWLDCSQSHYHNKCKSKHSSHKFAREKCKEEILKQKILWNNFEPNFFSRRSTLKKILEETGLRKCELGSNFLKRVYEPFNMYSSVAPVSLNSVSFTVASPHLLRSYLLLPYLLWSHLLLPFLHYFTFNFMS